MAPLLTRLNSYADGLHFWPLTPLKVPTLSAASAGPAISKAVMVKTMIFDEIFTIPLSCSTFR
ncbi:MAG: hypothetical protein ACAH83_11165 [Alphaproteobacteria bacterium]